MTGDPALNLIAKIAALHTLEGVCPCLQERICRLEAVYELWVAGTRPDFRGTR
jgi:hypothetical protein